jgi:hypothetical protein
MNYWRPGFLSCARMIRLRPLLPLSRQHFVPLSQFSSVSPVAPADGRGGRRGQARSQILRPQVSLALYTVNHSILSGISHLHAVPMCPGRKDARAVWQTVWRWLHGAPTRLLQGGIQSKLMRKGTVPQDIWCQVIIYSTILSISQSMDFAFARLQC